MSEVEGGRSDMIFVLIQARKTSRAGELSAPSYHSPKGVCPSQGYRVY